nr:NUDIX domain-containing protein [Microlunatus panaciterrae]
MLWRHRFVTDEWGWELQGGIVDPGEEGPASAAREVEEETGWRPGPLTDLLTFQPMIGMVDSPHELYVANSATRIGEPPDPEEAGRVDWVPLGSVMELMAEGRFWALGRSWLCCTSWLTGSGRLRRPGSLGVVAA